MATLSNLLLDKEILLESGTNELEVLVFDVADYTFGINVAKVREVLPAAEITQLPSAHKSIRGVFKLRNNVIPCVSLLEHLGIEPAGENSESKMILADFNRQQTAFLVDEVERIHRLSWQDILAVPGLEALSRTPVTALARCDDRLIVMLDFEMILDDVTDQFFRTDAVDNPLGLPREKLRILLAEDSPTVREAIGTTLRNSGYSQLIFVENGSQAWDWLTQRLAATGRRDDVCDLVISDVEMPQVDGLHLTKRVKEHPELKHIPVLLYSSIITPDNQKKGKAVGADAQVAKPELTRVVQLADELISSAQRNHRAAALRDVSAAIPVSNSTTPENSPTGPPAPVAALLPNSKAEPSRPPVQNTPASETLPTQPSPLQPLGVNGQEEFLESPDESLDDNDELPVPSQIDPHLWRTFHKELRGRTADLGALLNQAGRGDRSDGLFHAVARLLHTVKSAAMVVPVDPITHCTHRAESLVDAARHDHGQWPQAALQHYHSWLTRLLRAETEIDAVLAEGQQVVCPN